MLSGKLDVSVFFDSVIPLCCIKSLDDIADIADISQCEDCIAITLRIGENISNMMST